MALARSTSPPCFDDTFKAHLRDLLAWRRDVRRFQRDALPTGALDRLIDTACLAPSVGLSQPWRFVIVEEAKRRETMRAEVRSAAMPQALDILFAASSPRRYAKLKLAGLVEAPAQLAIFCRPLDPRRPRPRPPHHAGDGRLFGGRRRRHHVACGAGRRHRHGLGVDPRSRRVMTVLGVPRDWRFIGYFCLGYPEGETEVPELERAGWEHRLDCGEYILRR